MLKQTLRQLTIVYYSTYIAAIASATAGYYILKSGTTIDPLSSTGTLLNSLLIIFIIGSVPASLAIFSKLAKKWAQLPNKDERLAHYGKAGSIRLAVLGFALSLGVLFFYILGLKSMIFGAGIAAIGLFFCKPTENKIVLELNLDDLETSEDVDD